MVGFFAHLQLRMEHHLCLDIPRLGERIAFRKVDEAFVEALVIQREMSVHYAPDAVFYNTGPNTIPDFIKQWRRNHAGHLHLRAK